MFHNRSICITFSLTLTLGYNHHFRFICRSDMHLKVMDITSVPIEFKFYH
ncbi:hypothetical protein T08_13618 [Trichinella sp. T8]|nr:hypothetical protein T08_13618 [Trichinella sp. T8]